MPSCCCTSYTSLSYYATSGTSSRVLGSRSSSSSSSSGFPDKWSLMNGAQRILQWNVLRETHDWCDLLIGQNIRQHACLHFPGMRKSKTWNTRIFNTWANLLQHGKNSTTGITLYLLHLPPPESFSPTDTNEDLWRDNGWEARDIDYNYQMKGQPGIWKHLHVGAFERKRSEQRKGEPKIKVGCQSVRTWEEFWSKKRKWNFLSISWYSCQTRIVKDIPVQIASWCHLNVSQWSVSACVVNVYTRVHNGKERVIEIKWSFEV